MLILFILYHTLIFRKIFYAPFRVSVYKVIILIAQVVTFYIGLIIISEADTYHYGGIVWYVFAGRTILVGIFGVWIVLGVYWLKFMVGEVLKQPATRNVYQKIDEKEQLVEGRSSASAAGGRKGLPDRRRMTHQII